MQSGRVVEGVPWSSVGAARVCEFYSLCLRFANEERLVPF